MLTTEPLAAVFILSPTLSTLDSLALPTGEHPSSPFHNNNSPLASCESAGPVMVIVHLGLICIFTFTLLWDALKRELSEVRNEEKVFTGVAGVRVTTPHGDAPPAPKCKMQHVSGDRETLKMV